MSFPTITVYGNSDNKQSLRFFNRRGPVKLNVVTRVVIELNTGEELDSDRDKTLFVWPEPTIGVMSLRLGRRWWPTNIYYGKMVVYDEYYTSGLYWGMLRIRSIENTLPRG